MGQAVDDRKLASQHLGSWAQWEVLVTSSWWHSRRQQICCGQQSKLACSQRVSAAGCEPGEPGFRTTRNQEGREPTMLIDSSLAGLA